MLNKYTINCYTKENSIFNSIPNDNIELESHNSHHMKIYVHCGPPEISNPITDESFDNNSFEFKSYGDNGIVVNRNRCELDIYIRPNVTMFDKYFFITITHSQDINVYQEITILQPSENFTIDLDGNGLDFEYVNKDDIFDTKTQSEYNQITDETEKEKYDKRYLLELKKIVETKPNANYSDSNYNFYEEKKIKVNTTGGSETYEIKSLLRYYLIDEDAKISKVSKFDGGFLYSMYNNENIAQKSFDIKNYGKPFLEEKDFYEVTFCHRDSKDLYIRLKISYDEPPRRNNIASNNINKDNIKIQQLSDIYLSKEALANRYQQHQEEIAINKNKYYEINFIDNIEEELLVVNSPQHLSFPFNVTSNGEDSNLMVSVYSSGNWCLVKTDETNRKLLISIKDKPLCERKCYIKVEIVDYPNFNRSLIIKNKPL